MAGARPEFKCNGALRPLAQVANLQTQQSASLRYRGRTLYWLTCTTVAGGKPLKWVEEAWL